MSSIRPFPKVSTFLIYGRACFAKFVVPCRVCSSIANAGKWAPGGFMHGQQEAIMPHSRENEEESVGEYGEYRTDLFVVLGTGRVGCEPESGLSSA